MDAPGFGAHLGTLLGVVNPGYNTFMLSIYHSCDSTTIRRYHDAFDYDESDRNYCDTSTTKFIFCSRRMEAGARDTS